MVFEHIEKLKREYTDKFVIVDATRPELRRFGGITGTVRTVNMSGRALVEFDAYANIGWYDIDLDFLKVIDAPLPKPEAKAAAKKEAKPAAKQAEAKAAPKAAPAAQKAAPAAKPASGAGMSVADMLAAARGDKGGAAAPAAKPASAADIMAAARSEKSGSAAAAKVDPKSMSVAEMLAAARGETGGGKTAAAPASSPADPKAGVRGMLEAARKPKPGAAAVEEPAAEEAAAPAPAAAGSVKRRNDITSVAEQLAYCRKVDAR